MKKRADGKKRIEFLNQRIFLRWGDKEFKLPILGAAFLLILIAVIAVILYSDWSCGPLKHSADDMPKKVQGGMQ